MLYTELNISLLILTDETTHGHRLSMVICPFRTLDCVQGKLRLQLKRWKATLIHVSLNQAHQLCLNY